VQIRFGHETGYIAAISRAKAIAEAAAGADFLNFALKKAPAIILAMAAMCRRPLTNRAGND
jgi:hypothetical protein